jgi:hypothetical protein
MDLKVLGEQQFNIASCAGFVLTPNEARRVEVAVMFPESSVFAARESERLRLRRRPR